MRTTLSPENVNQDNTVRGSTGRSRRVLATVIAAGAFAGLSGLVAPTAGAQNKIGGRIGE